MNNPAEVESPPILSPSNSDWVGAHPRLTQILIALIILLGILLRSLGAGTLPPHVDETGNVLVALSEDFERKVDPVALARPLLSYLFKPVDWTSWTNGIEAVQIARSLVIANSFFVGILLTHCVWMIASPLAALVAATLWMSSSFLCFHDRLALQDPFMSLFGLSALTCYLHIARCGTHRGRSALLAVLAGVFWALCVLNKVIGISTITWTAGLAWIYCSRRVRLYYWLSALAMIATVLLICPDILHYGAHLSLAAPSLLNTTVSSEQFIGQLTQALGAMSLSLQVYNGFWFVVFETLLLAIAVLFCPNLRPLKVLFLLSFLLETAFFFRISYCRYYCSSAVLLIFFSSIVLTQAPEMRGIFRKITMVAALSLFIVSTIAGVSTVFTLSRFEPFYLDQICRQKILVDYCQYTWAHPSGGGLVALESAILEKLPMEKSALRVFVDNGWRASSNYLQLSFLKNNEIKVIETSLTDVDSAAVLKGWMQASDDRAFLVLDDYDEKFFSVGPESAALGLESFSSLQAIIPREASGNLHYQLYALTPLGNQNLLPLISPRPPYPDGFLAPRTLITAQQLAKFSALCNLSGETLRITLDGEVQNRIFLAKDGCIALSTLNFDSGSEPFEITFDRWRSGYDPWSLKWVYRTNVRMLSARLY